MTSIVPAPALTVARAADLGEATSPSLRVVMVKFLTSLGYGGDGHFREHNL